MLRIFRIAKKSCSFYNCSVIWVDNRIVMLSFFNNVILVEEEKNRKSRLFLDKDINPCLKMSLLHAYLLVNI